MAAVLVQYVGTYSVVRLLLLCCWLFWVRVVCITFSRHDVYIKKILLVELT